MARGEGGELTRRESTELARRDEEMTDEERLLRIRESMNESRRQIAHNLEELRVELREAADWKGWVDRQPWAAVGIAFGVGFFIGFR